MKSHRLNITFLLFLIFLPSSIIAGETLTGVTNSYPPYYGSELRDDGPIIEIVQKAFQQVGYDLNVKYMVWSRVMLYARKGSFDLVVGLWPEKEREDYFAFSNPIFINKVGLYKRSNDSYPFETCQKIKQLNIPVGNVRGYLTPNCIRQAGIKINLSVNDEQNMMKLTRGRLRFIISDKHVGQYVLNKYLPDQVNTVIWMATLEKYPLTIGFTKSSAGSYRKKLSDFNKGLVIIKSNGTLRNILRKHNLE